MITDEKRLLYCHRHSSAPEPEPVLRALERETHLRTLYPQMLSGPLQGMLLQMFSRMLRPHRILEVGTFTGYGSICLAQGLGNDGLLHTVEVNDEFAPIISKYIDLARLKNKITPHLGDANNVIPMLEDTFDLVFLDAGKMDYATHYELVLPKLRPGGFLLADNVLWAGKVPNGEKDATAEALRTFNNMVHADERVENLLLPLRDGLMVVRKKG